MARKEIGTKWDRVNRNNMNDNFKELYNTTENFVEKISEEAFGKVIDASKLVWKEPVDSQGDLPSSASEGDTRMARDSGKVYRFDGSEWKEIQQLDSSPINEVDERLSSQLAQNADLISGKASKQELIDLEDSKMDKDTKNIAVSQINKNLGKFDQTYLTDGLLQQIAGNTPVNAVPAERSITTEKLADKAVTPRTTTFFNTGKNLFDGKFTQYLTIFIDFNPYHIGWSSNPARHGIIMEIEEGETYTVSKMEGGDRFDVLTVNGIPDTGSYEPTIYSFRGAFSSDPQTHTFTNSDNAKYMVVITNFSASVLPKVQIEKGDTPTEYEDFKFMLSPSVRFENLHKDFQFNFYENLNKLYRMNNEIENFVSNPGDLSVTDYHNMFNSLISNHSELATSDLLGQAAGGFDLYKYEIKPPNYYVDYTNDSGGQGGAPAKLPKVVMTTGVHGHERSVSLSAFYFFREVLENPSNDPLLDFLKFNVHFICIPIVNPSGWTDGTYNNRNNINLNREFPPNRQPGEPEAIMVKQQLDINRDMDFFIDFHNMYFRDGYIGYSLTSNDMFKHTLNNMYREIGRRWQREYSSMPQELNHVWGYNAQPNNGTVGNYAETQLGIPSTLMEIIRENQWVGDGEFGESVVRMGVEYIVNAIAGVLRTKM